MDRPMKRRLVKALGLAGAALAVAAGTSVPAQRLWAWPKTVQTGAGEEMQLPWSRWLPVTVASRVAAPVGSQRVVEIKAESPGTYRVTLSLFGKIPWRGVPVKVGRPVYVVPGGESLGIVARTRGVVVMALSGVVVNGRTVEPAQDAGIERGDVITRVDGQPALGVDMLEHHIMVDGRDHSPVRVWVAGSRSDRERQITPVWAAASRTWRIGATVQDHTTGVGTLTFFNPSTYRFTALGHSISDGLTRRPVAIESALVTGAEIVGLVPASEHQPGQKVGVLAGPDNVSGTADSNGPFGIVGRLHHTPIWGYRHAIPVAYPDQVHDGPAQIVTVLHGQKPETFSIEILKTAAQYEPEVKGLLFKVTDPRLLRETGGIIQGMSGSPIIQNGRVVGAVTHVLVNRPSLGFGCYAYWMAQQRAYQS